MFSLTMDFSFSSEQLLSSTNSDDLILSQFAESVENKYYEDLQLSQSVSDMLSDIPEYNFNINFDLKTEPGLELLDNYEVKQEGSESARFAIPVDDDDIRKLLENQQNANTRKNTKWAYNVFSAWRKARGEFIPDIIHMDATALELWLTRFVMEARKQDGSEYPAKSLYYIVCGLLRYLRDKEIYSLNFLDEKDFRFANFRKVLDSRMKELVSSGVGTKVKQADPILFEDENKLWETGTFGHHSAESLQHTVFYYACKIFGLRGQDEHRALECSQFSVGKDGEKKYIRFVGRNNKTYQGGLAQMRIQNKDIKHYCAEGRIHLFIHLFI